MAIEEKERLMAFLKSFIADAEAMRQPLSVEELAGVQYDPSAFFGYFTSYFADDTMVAESSEGVRVYWPNLAILLDDARELLGKLEGEGQNG